MFNFSENAKTKIREILQSKDPSSTGLRLYLKDGKVDPKPVELTELSAVEEPLRDKKTHFFVEFEGFMLIVDREGQDQFIDGTLNFVDGGLLSSFFEWKERKVEPEIPLDYSNPLVSKVHKLLEQEINPGLAMHGGRAELIRVQDDYIHLKFGGGCQGCSQIDATVKQGIETRLKEVLPQLKGVVDVTKHEEGATPYF